MSKTMNTELPVTILIDQLRAKIHQRQIELDLDQNAGGYAERTEVLNFIKKAINDVMENEVGNLINFQTWNIIDELTQV